MNGSSVVLQITPTRENPDARLVTIRLRLQTTIDSAGTVQISDVLLQAGKTATGWVAHVTEMPWQAGIVGGA